MIFGTFVGRFSQPTLLLAAETSGIQMASSKSNTSRAGATEGPFEQRRSKLHGFALYHHNVVSRYAADVSDSTKKTSARGQSLSRVVPRLVDGGVILQAEHRREGRLEAVCAQEVEVLLEAEPLARHPSGRVRRYKQDLAGFRQRGPRTSFPARLDGRLHQPNRCSQRRSPRRGRSAPAS